MTDFCWWNTGSAVQAARERVAFLFGWVPQSRRRKVCPRCQKAFTDTSRNNIAKFCCRKCQMCAQAKRRWRQLHPRVERQCAWCRHVFQASEHASHKQIYCLPRCKKAARNERDRERRGVVYRKVECAGCGEKFKQRTPANVFCTLACKKRRKSAAHYRNGRLNLLHQEQCKGCGKLFLTTRLNVKFHSRECARDSQMRRFTKWLHEQRQSRDSRASASVA